jgi:hypothetical protein
MKTKLTEQEMATIQAIRNRGFAVIVWTPAELESGDVSPDLMEEHSMENGWSLIKS